MITATICSLTKIHPVHHNPKDPLPECPTSEFSFVYCKAIASSRSTLATVGLTVCLNLTALFCQSVGQYYEKCQKEKAVELFFFQFYHYLLFVIFVFVFFLFSKKGLFSLATEPESESESYSKQSRKSTYDLVKI